MEDRNRKTLVELIFLGLVPALAATVNTASALSMGTGIIFIVVLSTATMKLLGHFVTEENRCFVVLVVTAFFASAFQMVSEAFFLSAYKTIGIYIVLSSISMMVYAFASGAAKGDEKGIVAKALGFSFAYAIVMVFVGALREIMGLGTLWGNTEGAILEYFAGHKVQILQKAPGAFMVASIVLALVSFILRKIEKKEVEA